MDFTAIMIPQNTHQRMHNWSEKIRKVWHDQNGGKCLNKNKHFETRGTYKTHSDTKNNQEPSVVLKKALF